MLAPSAFPALQHESFLGNESCVGVVAALLPQASTKVLPKPEASAFLPGLMHGTVNPIRMSFKLYHTLLIQDWLRDARV